MGTKYRNTIGGVQKNTELLVEERRRVCRGKIEDHVKHVLRLNQEADHWQIWGIR